MIKPLEPRFERLLKSLIRCEPTYSRRIISLHMAKFEDPYFRNHAILIKYPDEEIEENYFKNNRQIIVLAHYTTTKQKRPKNNENIFETICISASVTVVNNTAFTRF